jgi:hypothetical protein
MSFVTLIAGRTYQRSINENFDSVPNMTTGNSDTLSRLQLVRQARKVLPGNTDDFVARMGEVLFCYGELLSL